MFQLVVIGAGVIALTAVFAQTIPAQCVEHPEKKTALVFDNQTSFDLTFFVDEDEKGVSVASRTASNELEVEPGEHLLRARAVVKGQSVWVWIINEVPAGHLCTWTITDPSTVIATANNRYRTAIAAPSKRKIKSKKIRRMTV